MKKMSVFLMAVMLCAACLSMPLFAAESSAGQMVPVVVHVPDGWEAPCLWAWADDGTNAFAAWPGEEMGKLASGWYYTYVPGFVQNVIVNANNGTDNATQTDGLKVDAGKEVWIDVAADKTASIAYEAQTRDKIPEYVEKFLVHAYVPLTWKSVNMWAWSAPDGTNAFDAWPGEPLKEGDDGWFTGKAPVWVNSLIINGNEGTVQTADVSIEGKELWITVYEDLGYDLSYEDPNKAVADITIHAQVPAEWASPACWAWSAPDGTNAFATWPGEPLVQDGNWYNITAPGWINSVIINGNEGSVQTVDVSVEKGKDLWLVVSAAPGDDGKYTAVVSYEEPAAGTAPATDSGNAAIWIIAALVAVAICIIIAVIGTKKKKN